MEAPFSPSETQSVERKKRGQYGKNSCTRCRRLRSKCVRTASGVCERCLESKTESECISGEDKRHPPSRLREESLRYENEELKNQMEAMRLKMAEMDAHLRAFNAGTSSHAASLPTSMALSSSGPSRLMPQNHTHLSNLSDGGPSTAEDTVSDSESDEESAEDSDSWGENEVSTFANRSRNLIRECGQYYLYGLTSPFRLTQSLRRSNSQRTLSGFRSRDESPSRKGRHVLLLPDTTFEPTCSCRSDYECWAKHLPRDVPLTRAEHDLLLDRLFIFYSSWGLRIIPEFFLRDLHRSVHSTDESQVKTTHYSAFLHLCILAVASAFSDDPKISNPDAREKFAIEAKKLIEDECSRPSIAAVQGLSMLSSYHSGKGQQTLGFVYFGMCARVNQALGLGADVSKWVQRGQIREKDLFDRYWCFHMACAQDACWALYVGREFGLPVGHNDPHELASFAESSAPLLDCMAWRHPDDSDTETKACHTFTTFLYTCDLMKISRKIMALMGNLGRMVLNTEISLALVEINNELTLWRDSLPPELQFGSSHTATGLPHKFMTHLAFWWLTILLHRPFYRRRSKSTGGAVINYAYSVNICNRAAKEILSLMRRWRVIFGTVRFAPITLVQITFASATVYLLAAHQACAPGKRQALSAHSQALGSVREAIDYLRELGQSFKCSERIADILQRVHDGQMTNVMRRNDASSGRRNSQKTIRPQRMGKAIENDSALAAEDPANNILHTDSNHHDTSRTIFSSPSTSPSSLPDMSHTASSSDESPNRHNVDSTMELESNPLMDMQYSWANFIDPSHAMRPTEDVDFGFFYETSVQNGDFAPDTASVGTGSGTVPLEYTTLAGTGWGIDNGGIFADQPFVAFDVLMLDRPPTRPPSRGSRFQRPRSNTNSRRQSGHLTGELNFEHGMGPTANGFSLETNAMWGLSRDHLLNNHSSYQPLSLDSSSNGEYFQSIKVDTEDSALAEMIASLQRDAPSAV